MPTARSRRTWRGSGTRWGSRVREDRAERAGLAAVEGAGYKRKAGFRFVWRRRACANSSLKRRKSPDPGRRQDYAGEASGYCICHLYFNFVFSKPMFSSINLAYRHRLSWRRIASVRVSVASRHFGSTPGHGARESEWRDRAALHNMCTHRLGSGPWCSSSRNRSSASLGRPVAVSRRVFCLKLAAEYPPPLPLPDRSRHS